MTRSILPLSALAGLVLLTGCASYGYGPYGRTGDYGDYRRAPDYDGRYGRTSDYRRNVERDANAYVNDLDRYLRISNREERAIRDLLVRRTYQLLDQTSYGRQGGVYPFPRRAGRARSWWSQVDRDIERILDRRYHEPYRYYNRYGADRYQEYYRYRRYDTRRGWYDTRRSNDRDYRRDDRYDDHRRAEARREAERREQASRDQRRRVEEQRRRAEEQRRRVEQDRRRIERERDERRRAEARRQADERRREDQRRDAERRREAERRDDRREAERRDDRRDDTRRDSRSDRRRRGDNG